MTSFVNDDGEYLDYTGPDVGITKQVANFFDFKIKGDISSTLKIDNNSQNRKALGYYGAQQINSPAYSKVPFSMVRDGNIISRGFIVINDSDDRNISCFYISGNTNWFQSFQFNIKETDFDDRFTVLSSAIDGRKSATEGIIFPLVDWWAQGSRRSTSYLKINQAPSPEDGPIITDVHPCIFLHTIVSEVGKYSGVNIAGDLITDALYKKIIITPDGPDTFVPDVIVERSYARIQNGPFGSAGAGLYDYTLDPQLVRLNTVVEGQGQLDTSIYAFYAPYTGTYRVDVDFWVNNVDTYSFQAWLNGSLFAVLFNQAVSTRNQVGTAFINLVKGDRLQFYVNNTAAANYRLDYLTEQKYTNVSIKLEKLGSIAPNANLSSYVPSERAAYVIPNSIVPDMKAIDLIKFLAMYFSCVVTYDEYANTIYLNQIKNFRKEDAEDWSDYFVSASTNYKTGVARLNYIQTAEGTEKDIVAYNAQSLVKYGGGTIETDFDSKEEKTVYEIPFSGSWDERNKSYSKVFMPYINFYDIEYGQSVAYSAVASAGGLARFTATFDEPIKDTDVFYVKSTSGLYSGFAMLSSATTTTTDPILFIDYISNDSGTITRCTASKVSGPNRMLICESRPIAEIGGVSVATYLISTLVSTITTVPVAWFDKPVLLLPIDSYHDSLAIDSTNKSNTIAERYYGPIKKVFNNPKVDAEFNLPLAKFSSFEFTKFVRIETKDLTGYFLVQKIENYRDALTPVKTELLYAD